MAPFHGLRENPTLALERDLDLITYLDRLNYHEAWIGEHHSCGVEIIGSPEIFVAVAAERSKRIRLGTGVASLPYHNPFMLADRMVQLDHITRGRVMFGVGPGALVHDAVKLGIDVANQRRMMDESLDVIMSLLKGETVTRKTDWFNLQETRLHLSCYTYPMMEVAVAASRTPVGAMAAGRHGVGMLSTGGCTDESLARHAGNWDIYAEQSRANGFVPDRRNWRVVGMFHVAETREKALQNVRFGLEEFIKYWRDVSTFPFIPYDVEDVFDYMISSGTACIGTPDDAIAYIERLQRGTGGYGVITELAHNWADWPETLRHYELMARYVHPYFQKSRELRYASYEFAASHHGEYTSQSRAAVEAEIEKRTKMRA